MSDIQTLTDTVRRLYRAWHTRNPDEVAAICTPDLQILILHPDGSMLRFDHQQAVAFSIAMDTYPEENVRYDTAEIQNGTGYVVTTRSGADGRDETVSTMMLRKEADGQWRLFREHMVITGRKE
ncbi:DUF4440 domain-containing protein [Eikenella sp. S3360]|uniref:DUF4440 domain-containing protein n=1 Tax=Eikenella glucosivorans TaxID=2766967 RepID=A0ABS0N9H4_9NEIS|nr:DUF4440 domain-containing protein [Eikenella glucosivorans]MBH5328946.1 DUF4440 domain-containing protein [Eikenella glucosivorans]